MKLADQFAAFLAGQGLKRVFGIPGTENLPLIEGLGQRGIDYVLVSHESSAALMADATAYLTGGLQACVVTRGPGATNLLPGAASAHLDGSPVLAITGEVDRKLLPQYTHQAIDLDQLYSVVSKGSYYLTAENAAETLQRAATLALTEKPGTVRLGLSGAEGSKEAIGEPGHAEATPVPAPDEAALESVLARVGRAERPVILVGTEIWRARQSEALVQLVERLGAPVTSTIRGKGVFPETHPNYLGVLCVYQDAPIRALLEEADLILAIGVDGGEFFVSWPHRTPVICISAGEADPYFPGATHLKGALGPALSRLASLPSRNGWGEAAASKCREEIERLFEEKQVSEGSLSPQRAARVLRESLPEDTIVTSDVGSHKLIMGAIWRSTRPGRFILSSFMSCMGGGVPAAAGASLEEPATPVLAAVGDGGMLMTAGELATLARQGGRVLVAVFNDTSLTSIRRKQQLAGYRVAGTRTGNTDFAAVAEGFGIAGFRATSESELAKAVEQWQESGGPGLVDVRIDFSAYMPLKF